MGRASLTRMKQRSFQRAHIPTDVYDVRLDGILTENYFKAF